MKRYTKRRVGNGWALLRSSHNLWQLRSLWLGHTLIWAAIMAIVWIGTWFKYPEQSLWVIPLVVALAAGSWYGLFYLCEVLLFHRRWYECLAIISGAVLLLVPVSFLFLHRLLPAIGLPITAEWQEFDLSFITRMWVRLKVPVLSSFLVVVLLRYRRTDRKLVGIVEERDALKNKHNEIEYKAQVNEVYSHFTFNMMNAFYADAERLSTRLASVVGTTADLLRYCLTSSRGTVVIDRELHYLQRFIDMQQWRFRNKAYVSFSVLGECCGQRVLPMSMISLVKNAYKHGYLEDPEHPLDIVVKLGENGVTLLCRNKVKTGDGPTNSLGSGLANIRKRLEFVFGERASLTYHNNGTFFRVELTIIE